MDLKGKIVTHRRALHQIPENAMEEYQTSAYIRRELEDLGYHVEQVAKTGLIAVKQGIGKEPPICFRADMDAIEIEEQTNLAFASVNGFTHACGHDGHMAILLGFAEYMAKVSELQRSIVFLFQPGEESAGGADIVMKDPVFQKYAISAIFGMHLQPNLPEGLLGSRAGSFMAQIIDFNILVEGKAGHGAEPHNGVDAIYVAAQLIESYQGIISRSKSPLESAVLTIGKIEGGSMRNLIAEHVRLEGTLRTLHMDTYKHMVERIKEVNKGLEVMHRARIEADFIDFCPPVVNDEGLYRKISSLFSAQEFVEMEALTISEDFGFYQTQMSGLFLMMGIQNEKEGHTHPLHSSKFNFNEDVLYKGVEVFIKIAEAMGAIEKM